MFTCLVQTQRRLASFLEIKPLLILFEYWQIPGKLQPSAAGWNRGRMLFSQPEPLAQQAAAQHLPAPHLPPFFNRLLMLGRARPHPSVYAGSYWNSCGLHGGSIGCASAGGESRAKVPQCSSVFRVHNSVYDNCIGLMVRYQWVSRPWIKFLGEKTSYYCGVWGFSFRAFWGRNGSKRCPVSRWWRRQVRVA